jgi:VWFA-related protein
MRRVSLAIALAIAVVAPRGLAQQAQQPPQEPQVFRSGVRTVPIYATVVDRDGRLVPNLQQEMFEVRDNGVPVPITVFSPEVRPISVVTLLDTSISMELVLDFVKDATETFLLRMLPEDRGRVATFDSKVRMSPIFTPSRDALIRYLREEAQAGNSTRLWDGLYQSVDVLRGEPNRRVVLVLSDGDDYGSSLGGRDVLDKADELDVMVYTIGMRNRYKPYGPAGPWETTSPDRFLRTLTQQTGGGHFELTRTAELTSTFTRIADELRRQYLIGVEAAADGREHRLEIRVKVPGMSARARRGYTAIK